MAYSRLAGMCRARLQLRMSLSWSRGFASVSPAGPCVDSLPTRPHVDLSYVHGASASPLTTTSVGGSLERSALTNPHRTAIVSCQQGVRLTFSQLLTRVDRLACGLMSLGLERGDRIGVWGPNSVEWVVTFLAASRAGLILVNVNPAYQAEELEFALKKVGCKAIVSAVEFKGRRYHQLLATVCPELLTSSPGEMHAKR
ncbi:medium-chain acyl-CoA ligase ACSF2, mitochondrial-like [Lampetra planeri]